MKIVGSVVVMIFGVIVVLAFLPTKIEQIRLAGFQSNNRWSLAKLTDESIELQSKIAVRVEAKQIHLFRCVEQVEQGDCTGEHQHVDQAIREKTLALRFETTEAGGFLCFRLVSSRFGQVSRVVRRRRIVLEQPAALHLVTVTVFVCVELSHLIAGDQRDLLALRILHLRIVRVHASFAVHFAVQALRRFEESSFSRKSSTLEHFLRENFDFYIFENFGFSRALLIIGAAVEQKQKKLLNSFKSRLAFCF